MPYLAPPVAAPSSELLLGRLGAYWRALGVTDPDQIAALSEQALRRAAELPETPGIGSAGAALLAAGELLDDWLARALDLPRQHRRNWRRRGPPCSAARPRIGRRRCSPHPAKGNPCGHPARCHRRTRSRARSRRHAGPADRAVLAAGPASPVAAGSAERLIASSFHRESFMANPFEPRR
jgi:hypothetical protein